MAFRPEQPPVHPVDAVARFPLQWPENWPRTRPADRQLGTFFRYKDRVLDVSDGQPVRQRSQTRISLLDAMTRLEHQFNKFSGVSGSAVLSTNCQLTISGRPRSDQDPSDPGAACYFTLNGKPLVLPCDRWQRLADNVAAIASHIDALRRIERYGVGTVDQVFSGYYLEAPANAKEWWRVLALDREASWEAIEIQYKKLAEVYHPDRPGGNAVEMQLINAARDAARDDWRARNQVK